MLVIGLTGGIASGKSFIIKHLINLKILTHESDRVVNELYNNPTDELLFDLKKAGLGKIIKNNKINKKEIIKSILSEKKNKNKLEQIIHKAVKKIRKNFIFASKKNKKKIVFVDVPLIFEKKLEREFDLICCAISPIKLREKRALQRKGMTKKLFALLVKNQVTDKERKLKSNFIINTSKSKKSTYLQVNKIIYDIVKKK